MAGNRPAREKFDFSLDARQVAGVILGSLGALGLAFFLGHSLGQSVAERPAAAPRPAAKAPPPADPLAALDHAPRPDGGEPSAPLSFHESLTSARPPPDRLPPVAEGPGAAGSRSGPGQGPGPGRGRARAVGAPAAAVPHPVRRPPRPRRSVATAAAPTAPPRSRASRPRIEAGGQPTGPSRSRPRRRDAAAAAAEAARLGQGGLGGPGGLHPGAVRGRPDRRPLRLARAPG